MIWLNKIQTDVLTADKSTTRKTICMPYIILGWLVFMSGCAQTTASPANKDITPIMASKTQLPEKSIATTNGLSIRETERVATVFAIQTASNTPLPTLLPTNTPTSAPSSTPKPLSKNDVMVSYTVYAGDGVDEITSCVNGYFSYQFVLYRDGQLIIFDGTHYLETGIGQAEIDNLFSEIDSTGFSSIIGDGDQYVQASLTPSILGGWHSTVTVGEKTIDLSSSSAKDLVTPVAKTLEIITTYRPRNLKPYNPESITIWVFQAQALSLGIINPTPEPSILMWPSNAINLSLYTNSPHEISDDKVTFFTQQVKLFPAFRRVEQDGIAYLVLLCPHLP